MRYIWPVKLLLGAPIMIGLGIYFLVHGGTLWGAWLLTFGAVGAAVIIWALRRGGWWRPGPSDRDYWDPDRRERERWDQRLS